MIREPYIGMPIIIGGNPGPIPEPVQQRQTMPAHPEEDKPQTGHFDGRLPASLPVAMTYTPMQQWKSTFSREDALKRGTVFPELELPFEGRMQI